MATQSDKMLLDCEIYVRQNLPANFISECGLLQTDITNICKWSTDWCLSLNAQKCLSFTITFKRAPFHHTYLVNSLPLQRVAEIRDLGIVLDSILTFSAHITSLITKANRALGQLFRSFQTGLPGQKLNRKALLAAYYVNVRSILEYGSVVWSGAAKTHLKRLERVQHKFLMWLAARASGTDRYTCLDYHHLLQFFHVSSLEARRTPR